MRHRLAATLAVLFAVPAAAEEPDRAAATALFEEGRRLVAAGRFADACPRFEEAQRIAPGLGIALNLADCWERTGRTASAWTIFREVARAPTEDERRADYARDRAAQLEPRLAHLTLRATPVPGLVLTRDGAATAAEATPVDPGEHVVAASAPGFLPWSERIPVAPGARVTVEIPALRRDPPPPVAPRRRLAPALVAGGGAAALGASLALALVARARYDDARSTGCNERVECDPSGYAGVRSARRLGDVATVVGGAGALALAAGAVWWLATPRVALVPHVAAGGVGLSIGGSL